MYQVLARKWRPLTFEELVGQQHVARALRNAVEGDRLAHAYIFAGVRGIGKTTVARIFAKCLNCENGPTATPCNQCTPCREITESRSLDVLEMDAASRRGIDSIRELQEVVSYAPVRDRHKVFILDEFHMLTKEAFNALLKTLEEPPPQIIFVLATTEIQKILPTILSRCQVFEFRRVSAKEVSAHLRKICDEESVEISDRSLDRIARAGEGSVRDSLSVLERVLAFCGNKVSDEDALQVLGVVRSEVLVKMIGALAERDAAAMLKVLDGLVDEGHDLVHFWSEWVGVLRDLLMLRVLPDHTKLLARAPEEIAALTDAAGSLTREDLLRSFQIVADLERDLKASSQPRFLFEATLIRLASLGAVRPIEDVLSRLESGAGGPPPPPAGPTGSSSPSGGRRRRPERKARSERKASGEGPESAFLASVHEAKPMLGAMLEEAASVSVEPGALVIRLAESADPLRKRLEERDSVDVLNRCARDALGDPTRVVIERSGRSGRPERKAPRERVGSPARREPRSAPSERHQALLETAKREPGIETLLHELGAQVVDIRPLEAPRDLVTADAEEESVEEDR